MDADHRRHDEATRPERQRYRRLVSIADNAMAEAIRGWRRSGPDRWPRAVVAERGRFVQRVRRHPDAAVAGLMPELEDRAAWVPLSLVEPRGIEPLTS